MYIESLNHHVKCHESKRGCIHKTSWSTLFGSYFNFNSPVSRVKRLLYQAWNKGEPARISDKLESVFQQCLCLIWLPPGRAGMPWLPSGAQIGIAANFNSTLDDPAGITNSTILINGKEVEWNRDIGTALKDALVFSPEAQKFAMVRAILLGRGDVALELMLRKTEPRDCHYQIKVYLNGTLFLAKSLSQNKIHSIESFFIVLIERLSWVIRMLCVCDYKQLP
uniref:Transmembrane protein 177 n=1 Tax=Oncorhynchus kisutch TaxID=8019 RepID=A0A8C7L6Q3_ONCKI